MRVSKLISITAASYALQSFSLSVQCWALVTQISALTCRWENGLGIAAYQSLTHKQTVFYLQIRIH